MSNHVVTEDEVLDLISEERVLTSSSNSSTRKRKALSVVHGYNELNKYYVTESTKLRQEKREYFVLEEAIQDYNSVIV